MKTPTHLPLPKAILFDLDGTLVDSAPDLAAAINQVRIEEGLTPVAYEQLRPVASAGAPGLIRAAFQLEKGAPGYQERAHRFLEHYSTHIAVHTTLFEGIPQLLALLESRGIAWGIVTNKIDRLTRSLVHQIGLEKAGCIISGDTTPHPKPHPEPLFEAARRLELSPTDCWYIGDDLRDIQAGQAAGTLTAAANWGYGKDTHTWNADIIVETPLTLLQLVNTAS